MSVLVPLGLLALISLPAIVVLHMRNVTPQTRPIPSLRFWLAANPRTTEQTRFRRPPITLLLILQLLIAAALALALARPVTSRAMSALGLDLRSEPRHLILLIDGSTSMSATDTPDGRSRFEAARTEALRELSDLREGDVATVLLLGTRTVSYSATDGASLGALRERIASVAPPGGRADLDAALTLAHDLLLPGLDDQVSVITDGAVAADPGTADRLGAPVALHLVGSAATGATAPNVAVVDLSSRTDPQHPAQPQLYARLLNFGPTAVSAPVALDSDGLEVSRQPVTLPPNGGSAELTWALPQGAQRVSVKIDAPDALAADNEASLVAQGNAAGSLGLDILLVSDAPAALQRALSALPGAQVTSQPTDGFAAAIAGHTYDLIVFDRTAPPADAAPQPGAPLLFVDPPAGGPFATNGVMTNPTVSRLRAQDPLLQGVDLSGATFGSAPIYQLDRGQDEVVGADQGPLVFRDRVDNQPAIVLAFDLTQSNLPQRVAFPILIANAVAELAPNPLPPSLPLGDPLAYRPRAGAATVRITPPDGKPVDLPVAAPTSTGVEAGDSVIADQLRDVVFSDTGTPGTYTVQELDAAGHPRGGGSFTVNAGHPRESDLRPNPDLAATLARAKAGGDVGTRASLAELWPPLALLGLALLAVEWIVALTRRRPGASRRFAGRSTA